MEKLLLILLFIFNTGFSQVDTKFSEYDSIFINDYNILRKSFGLNKVTPSLKLRNDVTNIHMQYLLNINVERGTRWAEHPNIISSNENLLYTRFPVINVDKFGYDKFGRNIKLNFLSEYTYLSVLYAIDMFYQSGELKKSNQFFDSFFEFISENSSLGKKINKEKYIRFENFVFNKYKDFWVSRKDLKICLESIVTTYSDFIKEKSNQIESNNKYYESISLKNGIIYQSQNGAHFYIEYYLGIKDLFVNKMRLNITYLFNKENVDFFRWQAKSSLYLWYMSEGHKQNLLLKSAKHFSIYMVLSKDGYFVALFNVGDENSRLIISKKDLYNDMIKQISFN